MAGVLETRDALRLAIQEGLDLVEISPNADPPVCKIMDFGKFLYEEHRKQKEARKHQHGHVIKEVKFHANTADHDYQTKMSHIKEFLEKGHKVKVTLTFRGRENAHKELGFDLINRVLKDASAFGMTEQTPKMMGRTINAMLAGKAAS